MLRRLLPYALCLVGLTAPRGGAAQGVIPTADTLALQRLLSAEDARGTGADGLAPLLQSLTSSDSLLRRIGVRGLGRFQRPELGRLLLPLLNDPRPAIRAEAANAIAQSMRLVRRGAPNAPDQLSMPDAAAALRGALDGEGDVQVADALAQSLGRLLLSDSAAARTAEAAIRARLARQATPGVVHGLYTIARRRRVTGTLDSATIVALRGVATTSVDTMTRRLALLALASAGGLDSATAETAARDADDESRRAMLRGLAPLTPAQRARLVRRSLADSSRIVRTEAIVSSRMGAAPPDCAPILAATRDPDPYIAIPAIDSLGGGCADTAGAVRVLRQVGARRGSGPPDHRWQRGAHALLALARLDRRAAAALLPAATSSPRAEVRQYAARAAAAMDAQPVLYRLARDRDRNVQELALTGLAATAGHAADSVYLQGLESSGFQVVLAAAEALKGTTHPEAPAALLRTFERLSALQSENARDPRISVLTRLGEVTPAVASDRLTPYLADFDTTVAAAVESLLVRTPGRQARATPKPLPIRPEPLAAVFLRPDVRLRVTMAASSGGGVFTLQLFPDEAPATVARVLRLVRDGFYDGRIFQRVEPNFVVQGGGPDANEYVGDTAFMRDELAQRTHARGTVGISARGRDTGDGQWFINLVDNPLLDHEFTIFGRIDSGQAVAEQILEGDRIGRIEVVTAP